MFASGKTAAVASAATYIEDVFSTYLYTGNGSSQTITNGIDLSTKGGLVWLKGRDYAQSHGWFDSVRTNGLTYYLQSDRTTAQFPDGTPNPGITLSTTGFTRNAGSYFGGSGDGSGQTYASWTFRKQPKFFDIVTYTGTGSNTTISHSLGSVPACIMVKRTDTTGDWQVYHSSLANTEYLVLNTTAAKATGTTRWNSTTPTSTVFSIGTDATVNASGGTYVAYIFAHDAGGFGLTGTDNVISCGSWTGNGAGNRTIELGYEPQFVLWKNVSASANWLLNDVIRGSDNTDSNVLFPNSSTSESNWGGITIVPTATGFITPSNTNGTTYIYIAIRRGPMKVPTSGTSVFSPVAYTGDGSSPKAINAGFVADAAWGRGRTDTFNWNQVDRLRGSPRLSSNATSAEATSVYGNPTWDTMTGLNGVNGGTDNSNYNQSSMGYIFDVFKRAPSFFDVVCYTGTGSNTTFSHNLGVVPELMIIKQRNGVRVWMTYSATTGNTSYLVLSNSDAVTTSATTIWNSTTPTSSVFSVGTNSTNNGSGLTYVAYLFATCAGVSKVGSYTGTGALQTVNCGFTGGARFVLIKRTDDVGDWYVYDSARGITSGNDPYLLTNSTAAEVTTTNYVDTDSTGFKVTAAAPAGLNASGGTYIFLAIA